MRCLWLSWSLTIWLSAILTSAGTLLPYWLSGHLKLDRVISADLGLYRRCGYPIYSQSNITEKVLVSHGCGHYPSLNSIPHVAWRISIVFLSISCAILFFLTFFLFFTGFNQRLLATPRIYKSCQLLQILSGLMVLLGCIIYPFGWHDNSEVRQVCGPKADYFNYGNCQIGWAMITTLLGGFISLLGATIPKLMIKTKGDEAENDTKIFPNNQMNNMTTSYHQHQDQQSYYTNGVRGSYYFNPSCDAGSSLLLDSTMTSPMLIHSPKRPMYPCSPKPGFDQISTDNLVFSPHCMAYPMSTPYSPQLSIRNGNFNLDTPGSYRKVWPNPEISKTPQLSRHFDQVLHESNQSPFLSPNRSTIHSGSMRNCRPYIETLNEVEYEQKTLHRKEDSGVSGSKESESEAKSDSTSLEKEVLTDKT